MAERHTPRDIAIAFTEAWTSRDMQAAARYVAEDVVFEGPLTTAAGITDFIDGLNRFARAVTGLEMLAAAGDEARAVIMYDLATEQFGTLRAAEDLVISNGLIVRDTLVFDTAQLQQSHTARDAE
jgi:SnoaL-like domain